MNYYDENLYLQPVSGNIEENKKKAAYYAKIVAKAGNVPVAPHIYFPTFLDEKNPKRENDRN